MFDISFSKILLVLVVGLIVLGPQKLAQTARVVGSFLRKARTQWEIAKAQIEQQIPLEQFEALKKDFQSGSSGLKQELQDTLHATQKALHEGTHHLQQQIQEVANPPTPNPLEKTTLETTSFTPQSHLQNPGSASPTHDPNGPSGTDLDRVDTVPNQMGTDSQNTTSLDVWDEEPIYQGNYQGPTLDQATVIDEQTQEFYSVPIIDHRAQPVAAGRVMKRSRILKAQNTQTIKQLKRILYKRKI